MSGAFEAVSRRFKWHVTVLLYSGLLTDLGSVFSVVVQGDEALRFFMMALSIDAMCELLTRWCLPLNRPGTILKSQCRFVSATVRVTGVLFGVIMISPLHGYDHPHPPFHRL